MSKMNLENSNRGFSFNRDEPLLMTYNSDASYTAYDFVNYESFEKIRDVLRDYGEEKYASRIAKKIIEKRKIKKIETSLELSQLIEEIYPKRNFKIHPATRTFQAIRIYINDELNNLVRGLDGAFKLIETGGTIVVLSYHSLEDRIVKKFFKQKELEKAAQILTKKPIIPTLKEINLNPSSRSAKLRAIKKIK
jgi:16S rRNA (cytosine1402-N4)-methyltransferase